jgi:hypothetical protein
VPYDDGELFSLHDGSFSWGLRPVWLADEFRMASDAHLSGQVSQRCSALIGARRADKGAQSARCEVSAQASCVELLDLLDFADFGFVHGFGSWLVVDSSIVRDSFAWCIGVYPRFCMFWVMFWVIWVIVGSSFFGRLTHEIVSVHAGLRPFWVKLSFIL